MALQFVELPQITRFSETNVDELFRSQMQLFTATVEALREGGDTDAIEQFVRLRNEEAAANATASPKKQGGK